MIKSMKLDSARTGSNLGKPLTFDRMTRLSEAGEYKHELLDNGQENINSSPTLNKELKDDQNLAKNQSIYNDSEVDSQAENSDEKSETQIKDFNYKIFFDKKEISKTKNAQEMNLFDEILSIRTDAVKDSALVSKINISDFAPK